MDPIILDDALKAKLNGLDQVVEVWEPNGKVVGQFVPQDVFLKWMYAMAPDDITAEELEHVRRSGTGKTLALVLKERGKK